MKAVKSRLCEPGFSWVGNIPALIIPKTFKASLDAFYQSNILLIEHFGEQRFDHYEIWIVCVNWAVDIRVLKRTPRTIRGYAKYD
jgi:hypothetical protein